MTLLVKICGLRTPEALDAALEAGADMVGFVFFPPSPRHLGFEAARALASGCRAARRRSRCRSTPPTPSSTALVEALKPDMLQLHGKETPERVAAVRSRFGLPVMKALPIASRADLAPIRLYATVADWLLFDARAPREATRPGGLGKTVRLAPAGKPRSRGAVHAVGRARCRQRRRGAADHARAGGRCVVRRRARAGREGPGQNPRLRRARARAAEQRSPASW